ncbi:MAG: carboxypeptidase-like regulatory domain-containing protein, partial [Saprospiraceae bacterium]
MLLQRLLPFCFLFSGSLLFAQTTITLSGTVSDEDSGETLIGATIYAPGSGSGTATNEYGFYSLTLPGGNDSVVIEFSYVGFQPKTLKILPKTSVTKNVQLGTGIQLQEVVVQANSYRDQIRSTEMSVEQVSTREVKVIPALLDGRFKIVILGHSAPAEASDVEARYALGFQRARAVERYLVSNDIPAERFEVQSAGARISSLDRVDDDLG